MSTTWKLQLDLALRDNRETWDDIESNTLSEYELNRNFDNGYGEHVGHPFTVWTKGRVYFPVVYDGKEWVGSVARHPDGKPTEHQGGE